MNSVLDKKEVTVLEVKNEKSDKIKKLVLIKNMTK